jgi:hypothetical protein
MRRHRVRAFVARSAGGPPWPCDPRGSTNQRCVRPTSAQSSNPSGTLIRSASALPLVAEGNRCGRRFHDAVARFGGQPGLLRRAFSSHGALRRRQPPLTSLSRPEQHAGSSERPRAHSLRQDRLTTHFVKDAPLPRPETPSPFRGTNRLVLAGDATRYVIRSLLRVLDPRTRFWLGAVYRVSRERCFRLLAKNPFITWERCISRASVACLRARATCVSPHSFERRSCARRSGANESRMHARAFVDASTL